MRNSMQAALAVTVLLGLLFAAAPLSQAMAGQRSPTPDIMGGGGGGGGR